MKETELAGVVCARICHDLASPVGAIVNGADLIGELAGADASEELALVEQSARRAAAMLQFHRLAFGLPRDTDARVTRIELGTRIGEVLGSPRITIGAPCPNGTALPMPVARLIALMALAARTMLGARGELQLLLPPEEALPASVIATGPKLAATAEQRGWLRGSNPELPDSRQVEFALLGPAAAAAGARLELTEDDAGGRLALRAQPA